MINSLLDLSTAYLNHIAEIITARFDRVISAGPRCATSWHIRRVFEQEQAYPLDWWVTPLQSMSHLLLGAEPFAFQRDDLEIALTPYGETVVNKRWLLQHHHDFQHLADGSVDPDDLNDDKLNALNQKYELLFERMRQHIIQAQAPLLVIGELLTLETWHQHFTDQKIQPIGGIADWHNEPAIEDLVTNLRETLNPNLTLLFCEVGDPACWVPSAGLIRIRSRSVKSSVEEQLEDHYHWIQPLFGWDLRWQMLANHLMADASLLQPDPTRTSKAILERL